MAELVPRGELVCWYCGKGIADQDDIPEPEDAAGWTRLAPEHELWCEWVAARGLTGRVLPQSQRRAGGE